jgi:hypothetical protein
MRASKSVHGCARAQATDVRHNANEIADRAFTDNLLRNGRTVPELEH